MSSILAPGYFYSQFLKAYGCELNKGIFPYEWFDSPEKLSFPSLPPVKDFHSKVSNSNLIKSVEEYYELKQVWEKEGMQTFKDYLIFGNNVDTASFCIVLKILLKLIPLKT